MNTCTPCVVPPSRLGPCTQRTTRQEDARRAEGSPTRIDSLLPNANPVARSKSDVGDGSSQRLERTRDHAAVAIGHVKADINAVSDDEVTTLRGERHRTRSVSDGPTRVHQESQ